MCVLARRFNGGTDSFESSPYPTLSRGAFSAPSLVTPTRGLVPGSAWFPFATVIFSLPTPPHTASGHGRRSRRPSSAAESTRGHTKDPTSARRRRCSQRPARQAQRQAYRRRKTRAQGKGEALRQTEAGRVEALPVQHPHAAGIDIGSRSHWVCVGFTTDAASCLIREFPAHTAGLRAIAAFLRQHQVNSIALESTGIYWIPLYELLQAEGFEVLLVDPSYSHQLRGRPKTDRLDCQWIYRLHSVGLLAAAFRPDEKTCQLRAYLRQRANLVRSASRHVQHLQKALEQMNLKLTEVLSDITGVTGLRHPPGDPARHAGAGEVSQVPRQAMQGQRGGDRPGPDRVVPGRAPIRAEAGLRGLAVHPGAGGDGGRADRPPVGADEVRPGLAAAEAEGTPEAPRQFARLRRAGGAVLCGRAGLDGDRGGQRADGADHDQRDRPGGVAVRDGAEVLQLAGAVPQLAEDRRPGQVQPDAPGVNRAAQALRLAAQSLHHSRGALGGFLRRMKGRLGRRRP